jgi:ribosomal protein L21E
VFLRQGSDLLRTRLRAGNFSDLPFGSSTSLFKLDKAETTGGDVVLDRLYYEFPVGKDFTVTVGPKVRNTEMSWIPTAYQSGILDFFTTAGAPGVYNKAVGAGVGAQYESNGFVAGLNYVAQNGDSTESGVFDSDGALNVLAQLGYRQDNWGVGVGYRYGSEGTRPRTYNGFQGATGTLLDGQDSNSVAVNAYWRPSERSVIPSISAGYGYNDVSGRARSTDATDSQSWFVGLQWDDAFVAGNSAGVAVGQPANAEGLSSDALMLEFFYKYQVTDNISVTPAVFYVSNDAGQRGNASEWGAVVQTTFKF